MGGQWWDSDTFDEGGLPMSAQIDRTTPASPPTQAGSPARTVSPFSNPAGAAQWVKGFLTASLVLAALAAVSGLFQMELISRAGTTGITVAEAAANDARQQLVGVVQLGLWVATGVAFFVWFHRVHRNLPALGGRGLKYTPGWAVGWFFVPFLNFVRPPQVMSEVWHGSNPEGLERDESAEGPSLRNRLGTPPLVGWWWALFLGSNLIGNFAARVLLEPSPTLGQLQLMSGLMVLSEVLDIPGALVAIGLITRITGWQAERNGRVRDRTPS